ncbi:MAG: hypothetical protein IJ833_00080 [Lachnospiraceae bacterium]|nr:hypothetical protein [Lachnospiraceae bacterium]
MSLLQMSLYAAVMITVVAVARGLLLNRLPKRTFIILWSVVLLRLLIPFQIPSVCSAYTLSGNALNHMGWHTAKIQTEDGAVIGTELHHVQEKGETVYYIRDNALAGTLSTGAKQVSWMTVLWMLGVLGVGGYFAISYYLCMREFRMGLPLNNEFLKRWRRNHPLRRRLEIRQLDTIEAPISYGIFKPTILLPKTFDWTEQSGARYVLEHEFVHIQRFDLVLKLLMILALCIHWFNPTVWLMYVLLNRDIELSCDETVVRRFGVRVRKNYALTLIGMEEQKSGLVPFYNAFGKNDIQGRIRAIMKMRKTTIATVVVAAVLVLTISIGFLTSRNRREENEIDTESTQAMELQQVQEATEAELQQLQQAMEIMEERKSTKEEEAELQQEIETLEERKSILEDHVDLLTQAQQELNAKADSGQTTEVVIEHEDDETELVNIQINEAVSTDFWRISTNPIPVIGREITRIIVRDGNTGKDKVIEDVDVIDEILVGILEANVTGQDQESRSGYQYLLILYSGEEEAQRFSISEGFIETNQVWYLVDSNERILSAIK